MNTDLLRRLCETPGIPGREERVRALIQKEVKGLFDAAEVDPLGALICRRAPTTGKYKGKVNAGATKVMLACHMDEIGFYVTHIDDQGFIRLNAAGGFEPTPNLSPILISIYAMGQPCNAVRAVLRLARGCHRR